MSRLFGVNWHNRCGLIVPLLLPRFAGIALLAAFCIFCYELSCLLALAGLACWPKCSAAKDCPTSTTTTGTGEREEQRRACCSSEAAQEPPGKTITSTEALYAWEA